jgi:flagellar hook-associated protein 3 FlgL
MRISTNTIFEKGTARMGELQTGLAKTQQQVSTGRKLTSPSDDPVASARAMEVTNAQEINEKYATNRRNAKDTLWATEGALQSVTTLLQDVKTLIVQAGNGTLDSAQRQYIATDLRGRFEELLGLANTRDGVGDYIFAGYQTATKPFAETSTGATYSGDQGQRQLQVHTGRQIDVAQHGNGVFEKISSTGTFATSVDTTNTGTGTISAGTITNSSLLTGHNYEIVFTGAAAFNVYDLTTDPGMTTPLPSSGAYTSGNPIVIDGIQVRITGAPAVGDNFSIRATSNQSVFTTIKDLINVLEAPTTNSIEKGNLSYGLSIANTNVDKALDHVLTVRASVGSSLKEIESLDSLGEDLNVQYAKTLSELQDLDYVQAVTDLTKQQVALQAAQQSFMKVTSLSLFNYMS